MRKYRIRKFSIAWWLIRLYYIVAIALLIWFGVSYLDVLAHNLGTGHIYSNWNLFQIFR